MNDFINTKFYLDQNFYKELDKKYATRPAPMKYCARCVYPSCAAIPLTFDERGVCSGCRVHHEKDQANWEERGKRLERIAEQYRANGSNYDCLIPVSGGKDSWFQTYYAKEILKLNPLLVTYNGNNYLSVGLENLKNMRITFGVDHIFFSPSVPLLIKMNRLCFKKMGDMNWHAHCGITTYPVQIAVKFNIPLIVWGEHGYTDMGGMYSMNDFVEMTAKHRLEHLLRGFDWYDMIDAEEGIEEKDLLWAKYPTDKELLDIGVRGIYLGNYTYWDANKQTELVKKFGFKESPEAFERTYRRMSNLDDMHENGIHDYLKYIKFGYGRATDHASKDIRLGYMTREEGVAMVKKHDSVKSRDLYRWLEYVNMTEDEFDRICDTFRDPSVWWRENGGWKKDNIWD